MTERQRTRLLQAYVALAFVMAGALLHNFLTQTLVGVPSAAHAAIDLSRPSPSSISNPATPSLKSVLRLVRTSSSGNDHPLAEPNAADHWTATAAAKRRSHDGLHSSKFASYGANRPRGPPAIA
jgi:hypothetical protein